MNTSNNKRRVYLVTGATGAIGKAIARLIAAHDQTEVILLGRDEKKTSRTLKEIIHQSGNPHVRAVIADLSRPSQILALANQWEGQLHVLINNASTTPRQRLETPEGIEMQFAVNVLGYFGMMMAFEQILAQSTPARVVNVASYWAGGLNLDDLEFKRRPYTNGAAYRQSKQAERMLTAVFAELWKDRSITVNACHPGDVNSKLSNDLGFGGHESPDEGARTPVWLATEAVGGNTSGKYFEHLREVSCPFMADRQTAEKLYNICLDYWTKLTNPKAK